MRFTGVEFKPGLWPSLATVLAVVLLCALGIWQLERAAAKRELLGAYARYSDEEPIDVGAGAAFDVAERYRRVRLTGRFDSRHQFLLDNQVQDGSPGYRVFTPLILAPGQQAILVNRGWVAMGATRGDLPALPAPDGDVTISGVLAPEPGHGLLLGADIESDRRWPRVVQAIVLPRLQQDLDHELAPQILQLDPSERGGFVRKWEIVSTGPERNLGYAFQWFTMAAVVLVIFVAINARRTGGVKD